MHFNNYNPPLSPFVRIFFVMVALILTVGIGLFFAPELVWSFLVRQGFDFAQMPERSSPLMTFAPLRNVAGLIVRYVGLQTE